MIYLSLGDEKRAGCGSDVPKIIKQTLISLKLDHVSVITHGLKLLEALVTIHASIYIPDLPMLFTRLQVYADRFL